MALQCEYCDIKKNFFDICVKLIRKVEIHGIFFVYLATKTIKKRLCYVNVPIFPPSRLTWDVPRLVTLTILGISLCQIPEKRQKTLVELTNNENCKKKTLW